MQLYNGPIQSGICIMLIFSAGCAWAVDGPPQRLATRSRAPFVHRLTLYDALGRAIDPRDPAAAPYSPTQTCGKCHPVELINSGLHFNARDSTISQGRTSQPWFWTDPLIGQQLPLSYRKWPGTFNPEAFGISRWDFDQRFGRHQPGDSTPEERAAQLETMASSGPGAPEAKLKFMGAFENDCMACHASSNGHDQQERARLLEDYNVAWIPTVAMGLATISGSVKQLPPNFDPEFLDPSLANGNGLPLLQYDLSRFDPNQRVLFDMRREPANERCVYCHDSNLVSANQRDSMHSTSDVHVAAGFKCVDCHHHGLDHNMVRGFEGEWRLPGMAHAEQFSCRGCHYGHEDSLKSSISRMYQSGAHSDSMHSAPSQVDASQQAQAEPFTRKFPGSPLPAPFPKHAGLPPLHLTEMACTACHSGPLPQQEVGALQTAQSHGLGLARRDWKDASPPRIAAPLFARGREGRIATLAMAEAAFWGTFENGKVQPLAPSFLNSLAARIRGIREPAALDAMTSEQLKAGLTALANELKRNVNNQVSTPAYVANNLAWTLNATDELVNTPLDQPAIVAWPMGHDVRSAAQALGAGGCRDCHAAESPFFHGRVKLAGFAPLPMAEIPMRALFSTDSALLPFWERAFALRGLFKWVLGAMLVPMTLWLLAQTLAALASAARARGNGHLK